MFCFFSFLLIIESYVEGEFLVMCVHDLAFYVIFFYHEFYFCIPVLHMP